MRLFHVSEENNIELFEPRIPTRPDLNKSKGLVWAINELCLPNFLTPRDCPRVAYYAGKHANCNDQERFFSCTDSTHVVAIESTWFKIMRNTTLYIYEFDPNNFYLQDEVAGYYVSENAETPINKYVVDDIFAELFNRDVELRILHNLWDLGEEVKKSTLNWSLCRMSNAKKKDD